MQRCKFIIAGNVDDGKSTLTGRLLLDSDSIKDDIVNKTTKNNSLNLAHITDGLKNERLQGITIDVAYQYFTYNNTSFTLIDAPGHKEYTKNMISGASNADIIIILIDVSLGITEQTKRHTYLAHLLKIPHLIVAINKMDSVSYCEKHFNQIKDEFKELCKNLVFETIEFVPISGLIGDNVIEKSKNTLWYKNNSIINILQKKSLPKTQNHTDKLVASVQFTLNQNNKTFFYTNTLEGKLETNQTYLVLPSNYKVNLTHVFNSTTKNHIQEQSVFNTLKDDENKIKAGNVLVNSSDNFNVKDNASAILIWLNNNILNLNSPEYTLKIQNQENNCKILSINKQLDIEDLTWNENINKKHTNNIYQINLKTNTNFIYNKSPKSLFNRGILICNNSKKTIGVVLNLK